MGALVGSFRQFGLFGPPYEVLGPGMPGVAGVARLRIRLIQTGEETECAVERVLADLDHA